MSTVAVTACMYLGDVAPFIPVARELVARGHEVVFVAPEGFRSLVHGEPFRFHPWPLDASPRAMNADPRHTKLMRHPGLNMVRLGQYWMDLAFTDDPKAVTFELQALFGRVDAVVTHPTTGSVTVPLARAAGVPVVVGNLFPMTMPTSAWTPGVGSRSLRLPTGLSRATWWLARSMSGRIFRDKAVNDLRRGLGLAPIHGAAMFGWTEADEVVALVSRHYVADLPPEWPEEVWGGFSIWDGPPGQALDPELDAYVEDGDPPVLVTLGTSAATDAGQQFARIAADLDALGLRSVLLVGHEANLAPLRGRPGVATFAPMTQLLPRCRAAVVSGALGSVAAALSAAVPTVVHPQLYDQRWNGGQVGRLGVGTMATRSGAVAAAVSRVCRDPAVVARAASLGERLRQEDGAGATADAVDRVLTR